MTVLNIVYYFEYSLLYDGVEYIIILNKEDITRWQEDMGTRSCHENIESIFLSYCVM